MSPTPVSESPSRRLVRRALDGLYAWRDRLVADPAFQRRVAAFPPTRWVARRKARKLFDLVAGFVYSQVLEACVRLDLFAILAQGPATVADLAPRLKLEEEPARRLLEAAEALGLLSRRGADRFGLGELGAALLGNPGAVAMIRHHHLLYADLADPLALLRGELTDRRLERYWGYARAAAAVGGADGSDGSDGQVVDRPGDLDAERVAEYSALMAASNTLVSEDVLDAYPLDGHQRLLDVGGGEGVFLAAALGRAPHLSGMLFDLPAVADRARARLAEQGLADRTEAVGGDFQSDTLPKGADLITFVRVLHDHEDALVRRLLAQARAALPPDGTLVIAEPMAGAPGAEGMAAYFLIYLMAMGSGRPRSFDRLEALVREAGFSRVRRVPTRRPLLVQLLEARP